MAPTIARKVYDFALAREGQEGTTVEKKGNNVQIDTALEGSRLRVNAVVDDRWVEDISAEIDFEDGNVKAAVSDVLEIVAAFDESGKTRGLLSSLSSLQPFAVSIKEDGMRDVVFYFEFKGAKGTGTNLYGHNHTKPELYPAVEVIFEEFLRS